MKGPAHPLACFGRFRAVSGRFRDVVRAAGGGPDTPAVLSLMAPSPKHGGAHLSLGFFFFNDFFFFSTFFSILAAQRGPGAEIPTLKNPGSRRHRKLAKVGEIIRGLKLPFRPYLPVRISRMTLVSKTTPSNYYYFVQGSWSTELVQGAGPRKGG